MRLNVGIDLGALTRRQFLTGATAAGAAAVLPQLVRWPRLVALL